MLRVFGKARIQHADTGVVYEISVTSLDFENIATDERKNGIEITYTAELDHPELGALTWEVWEYPIGILNHNDCNIGKHKLLKDFNFEIEEEIPDDAEEERQDRIDGMVEWFKENFEDPAESVTYVSSEGGYQWQNDGPCDAREELENKFPDEHEEFIESAVEEIESDGTVDWTPIQHPRDSDTKDMFPERYLKDIEDALNTLINNAPKPKTAPDFALGNDNRFHIIDPPDNQPVDSQNNLLNGLRTITNDLLQSLRGANAHQDLIPIIKKYKEALFGDEISISQLYWCGIRLDKIAQIIKRGIAEKELPSLPTNTETYLESALEIHGTYIMSNPEGQILVRDSVAYRQPPEQTEVLKTAGEQFANSVAENPNLFGEDVQEHFRDFSNDIGNGQYPERSNQSFGNTVINFVSSILRWIKRPEGMAISAIFGSAVATSVPGKIAIKAVAGRIDTVYYFLINTASSIKAFATQSPWLAEVVQFLGRIISIIG